MRNENNNILLSKEISNEKNSNINKTDSEKLLEELKDLINSLYNENVDGAMIFRAFLLVILQYSIILFFVWLGDHTSFNEKLDDLPGFIAIPIIALAGSFFLFISSLCSSEGIGDLAHNHLYVIYIISLSYICIQLTNYFDTKYMITILCIIMANSLAIVIYVFIFPSFTYMGYLISIVIMSLITMLSFGYTILKDSTKWILIATGIDIFEVIFTSLIPITIDSFYKNCNNGMAGSNFFNYGRITVFVIIGIACLIIYAIIFGDWSNAQV